MWPASKIKKLKWSVGIWMSKFLTTWSTQWRQFQTQDRSRYQWPQGYGDSSILRDFKGNHSLKKMICMKWDHRLWWTVLKAASYGGRTVANTIKANASQEMQDRKERQKGKNHSQTKFVGETCQGWPNCQHEGKVNTWQWLRPSTGWAFYSLMVLGCLKE